MSQKIEHTTQEKIFTSPKPFANNKEVLKLVISLTGPLPSTPSILVYSTTKGIDLKTGKTEVVTVENSDSTKEITFKKNPKVEFIFERHQ